jgi:DNA-3-methyladenine glycosylase II
LSGEINNRNWEREKLMTIFEYGQREIDHLSGRDRVLGQAITEIGMIEREIYPDLFTALVRNIVAQQIAKKAAATVWGRMCAKVGDITAAKIAALDTTTIKEFGMSRRKAGYIKSAAVALLNGDIQLESFSWMTDEEIIKELTMLPGVGVWTAEMLLIFSLARPDVLSWGDLALKRGLKKLYRLEDISRPEFHRYKKRYTPYSSVASLYLWELGGK